MSALSFRPYLPTDAAPLADLFVASIEEGAAEEYDAEQIDAWASAADDTEAFGARLAGLVTILAERKGELLGFAALRGTSAIDLLHVAPDAAGQGVGKALVGVLELLARQRGAEALNVDAPENAIGFFEHLGFVMQARNSVRVGECWLTNTTLKKALPPAAPASGTA